MTKPLHLDGEQASNAARDLAARFEPRALRTFTPTQAVLARSAGVYHWTPEGRRLFDFTSGVLVANLGHNPARWASRFARYLSWPADGFPDTDGYFPALTATAYNAVTHAEAEASRRLVALLRGRPGGGRMEQVM